MAVNGWNNSFDNNSGLSYGVQLNTKAGPTSISLGYLGGPEQNELVATPVVDDTTGEETGELLTSIDDDLNSQWRHFIDVVVQTKVEDVNIIVNANYVTEEIGEETVEYLGAALIVDYFISKNIHTAVRGEYIQDADGILFGVSDGDIKSGTLTVGYIPRKQLEFKADLRYDMGAHDYFAAADNKFQDNSFQIIVGATYFSRHKLQ